MQSVSNEWCENQQAMIRRPGFVQVIIPQKSLLYDIPLAMFSGNETKEDGTALKTYRYNGFYDECTEGSYFVKIQLTAPDESEHYFIIKTFDESDTLLKSAIIQDIRGGANSIEQNLGYFRYAEITTDTALTINTLELYSNVLARRCIQFYSHSRSFDPMGFELPTNTMSVDLINYDFRYTNLYKNYNGEPFVIKTLYGYDLLSGRETIKGGTFKVSEMSLNDDILTITGESSLAFLDDKSKISFFDLKGDGESYHIHIADDKSIKEYTCTDEDYGISLASICDCITEKSGITIEYDNVLNSTHSYNANFNETYSMLIQAISNITLTQCIVTRSDTINFCDKSNNCIPNAFNTILLMNCLEKPVYTATKRCKGCEFSYEGISDIPNSYTDSGNPSVGVRKYTYSTDMTGKRLKYVSCGYLHDIYVYKDRIEVSYQRISSSGTAISIITADVVDCNSTVPLGQIGTMCDVSNPIGKTVNPEKIGAYFSNQDLYEFTVRGNPARDVGDYIRVSLTDDGDQTSYKKGLVLSSDLTFDGSFKEDITVRIIDIDFE